MTDVLRIIEQTEPRVLPAAMSFVLTTLDDVSQQRKDWRVEVHPNFTSD